jgi:gentisate 1,2-dioxygenase
MVWLDGLDIPLISALDAGFAEHRPDRGAVPTPRPAGDSLHRWGASMRPARLEAQPISNPVLSIRTGSGAQHLQQSRWATARMPMMGTKWNLPIPSTAEACWQRSPPSRSWYRQAPGPDLRSSDGSALVVTEGGGRLFVEEEAFDLQPSDICVVPSWKQRQIEADEDLVLFSYSDKAAQQKLNLWREELL